MSQFLSLLLPPLLPFLSLFPSFPPPPTSHRPTKEGRRRKFISSFSLPPSFPRFFVVPSFSPPSSSSLSPLSLNLLRSRRGGDSSSSSFQSPFLLRSSFLLITEKGGEEEAPVGKPTLAARSSEGGEEGDFQVHYPSRREGREGGRRFTF